ncbi:Hypothetical predicted protein [Paramuricea clavata]|uniref:Uncharacterized protein n=1 Tax=Paramuricea clavata TaxID=317549 RepID=A0A6S7KXZ4_PARCT|nr:Hypothetical predicted protein [Paramuricea clavata]
MKTELFGEKYDRVKEFFEGDCCALAYNSDQDWFDDEDEEFAFDPNGSNKWFDDAYREVKEEQNEMKNGYRETARRQLMVAEQRVEDAREQLKLAWDACEISILLETKEL